MMGVATSWFRLQWIVFVSSLVAFNVNGGVNVAQTASKTGAGPPETSTVAVSIGEITFVPIPAGQFRRGFSNENSGEHRFRLSHPYSNSQGFRLEVPAHQVAITQPFEIAKTEITVAQFRVFVDATGYVTDAEKGDGALAWTAESGNYVDRFQKRAEVIWKKPGFDQADNHPVTCVSWHDAQAYCQWLSKNEGKTCRLPTEAEWEYACRAESTTWYSWGEDPDTAYSHANVADAALEAAFPKTTQFQRAVKLEPGEGDGYVFTSPVGHFKPNSWGLHDLHGNVWEWCQDRWTADCYEQMMKGVSRKERDSHVVSDPVFLTATDQHKFGDWRVIRGGSWTCAPASVRSSIRTYAEAADATIYTGFRVVRESTK